MIPLRLRIAGFLSYRDPVELDFTGFDLACISGHNGAGKSSLLDAITWALFGQARRRDESLINLQSKAAELTLVFQYEGHVYRIQRAMPRGKTPILEFQVMEAQAVPALADGLPAGQLPSNASWRPLTERTLRETQQCIEETLRLDYETFVNASFFLQGKADQFTQQTASKRKEVLSSILGLEVWETYRDRAAGKRKSFEDEVASLDRRIREIDAELAEDGPRKQRLADLEAGLKQLTQARQTQEAALEGIRQTAASLEQQRKLVDTLVVSQERARAQLASLQNRLDERQALRDTEADLLGRAKEIQAAYETWKQTSHDLAEWEEVASAFREQDQARTPLLAQIAAEKARLEEERRNLGVQQDGVRSQQAGIEELQSQVESAQKTVADLELRIDQRKDLENRKAQARETQARLEVENEALKLDMNELRNRIETLKSAEGAACPLCGQPLSREHRHSTLKQLQADGKEKGDRYRANKAALDGIGPALRDIESSLAELISVEAERLAWSKSHAQLTERMKTLKASIRDWESGGGKRLKELDRILEAGTYASQAQKELARINKSLAKLGYEAAAHDRTREDELAQRTAEEQYRRLESARAALAPLESEISNLSSEMSKLAADVKKQEADVQAAQASLEQAERQAPDLDQAEQLLFSLREQENRLNQEVGAARQKVTILEDLRVRKKEYAGQRESLAVQISQHRSLERAFGKDGVPALLIEQALPEIESRANELLDRLSGGQMSVRFVTQTGYKDKKREDLRETLDIQISDGAGLRDYEMYSGGEAFRVDFAIRLALSEVLAQRKGARLQTLVIDEGFGSQDIQGRQRLIEAINLVKQDFAKIFIITHLDELKDAFPTRIEVEKTENGSMARVV